MGKRSKNKKKQARGFGDTVANFTEKTGIKKAVEVVTKAVGIEDCGCDKRQELWNKLWPYSQKPLMLTEEEAQKLDYFFINQTTDILTNVKQVSLIKISNRIFNRRDEVSTCTPCAVELVNNLKTALKNYKAVQNDQ